MTHPFLFNLFHIFVAALIGTVGLAIFYTPLIIRDFIRYLRRKN